jgi:GNAT superfamily N-acetyltransferase
MHTAAISLRKSPPLDNGALNSLFTAAWPEHVARDFAPILQRSLAYLCAYHDEELVGFVNLAWDGGRHAFVLDPTVDPRFQRRGIGVLLLREAARVAAERGVEWLHVDFTPELEPFYRAAGFRPTAAGLMQLRRGRDSPSP